MKTNYASMTARINKATTLESIEKLDKSLDRLYNAGIFTVSELQRLDAKLCDKLIALEG